MTKAAAARRAYVLGHPIAHSLSPVLHTAAYQVLKENIAYARRDTLPEDLPALMDETEAGEAICGFSVTMPLKTDIIRYLHSTTALAQVTGAVNTVFWRKTEDTEAPLPHGHNTDVGGIVNALLHAGLETHQATTQPAILGGGATAISALAALHRLGYTRVTVYARSLHKLSAIYDTAKRLSLEVQAEPLTRFPEDCAAYYPVISTLPAHAADDFTENIHKVYPYAVLLDVAYDPWPSQLAQIWERRGGRVVSGLEMLLYQALDQVRVFTGHATDQRLPHELDVLNAMCAAVNLAPREQLPDIVP